MYKRKGNMAALKDLIAFSFIPQCWKDKSKEKKTLNYLASKYRTWNSKHPYKASGFQPETKPCVIFLFLAVVDVSNYC